MIPLETCLKERHVDLKINRLRLIRVENFPGADLWHFYLTSTLNSAMFLIKSQPGAIVWSAQEGTHHYFPKVIELHNTESETHSELWALTNNASILLFNSSVVSDSLWPHGLQHTGLPCSPLSPGVCSNSRPMKISLTSFFSTAAPHSCKMLITEETGGEE